MRTARLLVPTVTLLLVSSGCLFNFFRGIELEPGDIAGRAVNERGEPIPFARVQVPGTSRLLYTAETGRFVLSGLRAGTWTVRVQLDDNGDGWPERAARRTAAITVERHAEGLFGLGGTRKTFVDLGDVVLTPAVDVTGTVEQGGAPAGGAVVVAAPLDGERRLAGAVNVGTDADGVFRLVLPAQPFEIFALQGALASEPIAIAPSEGDTPQLDPLVLEARAATQEVELDTWPPSHETIAIAGRSLFPADGVVEQVIQEDAQTPVAFTLPVGTHDLVVRDDEADEALLFAQVIPPADGPVRIGAVDLGETACRRRGEDCDGDGFPSLPPAEVPDNVAAYATCATQCSGAWGAVARTCFFAGNNFDCDDDGDGQPDTTEPATCHGPGRGGDLDGDGACDTRDVFPRCRANDPADPLCSPYAAAPRPGPRPEYVGVSPDAGPPPTDGGAVDGGAADGGAADGGAVDGGDVDGGDVDGGDVDGGAVDGGDVDDGDADGGVFVDLDAGPLPDGCGVRPSEVQPPDLSFAVTSPERAYVYELEVGVDGHIYFTGETGSLETSFTLGRPGARCVLDPLAPGTSYVASLDATGACRWLRALEGVAVSHWRLTTTADGLVVVDSTHGAAVTVDGVSLPDPGGLSRAAVIRYRGSDGSTVDGRDLAETTGVMRLEALAGLPDGALAVTGTLRAAATFGAGEPNETLLTPTTVPQGYVAVYECDLSLRWATLLDPALRSNVVAGAELADPPGTHVFVAANTPDGVLFGGTANEMPVAFGDSVVVALGPTGALAWAAVTGDMRNPADVRINDAATLLAVTGDSTVTLAAWDPGTFAIGPDGGPGDAPAFSVTDSVGLGTAGVALFQPGSGQVAGVFQVAGDDPFAYGLAFTSDTSLALGGFAFANVPISGPEGPDAGVSRSHYDGQGVYVAHVDVSNPAAPTTRSLRVADSDNDMWLELGAFDALPDGSVVTGGYAHSSIRHDGVPGYFTGGTDRAWVWRSRDGDEDNAPDPLDTAPCGPAGHPRAADVIVEVIRDDGDFDLRNSASNQGEVIGFNDVAVAPDGGPVAFAEDRYLSDGIRIVAAGGRYAHPDFGQPAEYPLPLGNGYAPGPVAAPGAAAGAGANLTEVRFETGTCQQALTTSFGAMFWDADEDGVAQSALRVYDGDDVLIHEELVTTADGASEFVGIVTTDELGAPVPAVARVEIVNGQGWPGTLANEGVVLDLFSYGVPRE